MASTTLYPFLMDTYMPAFIKGSDCKIYFSLPSFNSEDEFNLNLVQIRLTNPNTNLNLLDTEKYPTGIKFTKAEKDNASELYYVVLNNEDKDLDKVSLGQYYKVQVRGTRSTVTLPQNGKVTESWLVENADNFSEWSTATLIRMISQPILSVTKIEGGTEATPAALTSLTSIEGILSFEDETDPELLNTYRILIYDSIGELVEDSGSLMTNFSSPNTFNYNIKYKLRNGFNYTIDIDYTTINGYSATASYPITISPLDLTYLRGTITAEPNSDRGVIRITVSLKGSYSSSEGTLYIRRTSYKSNFNVYETIHQVKIKFKTNFSNYIWDDYTAESGVFYKYSMQYIDVQDTKENAPISSSIVLLDLEDIYLLNNNVLLKIKFNPSVSSYKYNVTESITNTLGSKYPYVRRNGNNYYRTFSIGGLISFLSDPDEDVTSTANLPDSIKNGSTESQESLFLSKKEAFKIAYNLYNQYVTENNISDYNEYIFERLFREKAEEFLNDSSIKLLRSGTEGNILVKLSNVSFTPNSILSNRIYSFTATATEVDECTIDNYYKYNIISSPDSDDYASRYILETVYGPETEGSVVNGFDELNSTAYVSYQKIVNDNTLILNEEQYQI